MSSSLHRPPEDRPGLHEENGHATVPRPSEDGTGAQPGGGKILGADLPKVEPTEQPVNNTPSKTPAPVAKTTEAASKTPAPVTQTTDPASKTQKTKGTGAQRFVSLSKQGLAKAVGAAGGKTGASKAAPDEPKETSELRVVYPRDPASAPPPRVDIIAVHDIDETLQRAWIYRKKTTKRRANDSRAPFAAGGINSHDGTAGSPAPRHGSRRQPPPGARKKTFDDANNNSIEKWLAGAARPSSAGEPDISEQKPRFRRRPTLHNDRRRAAAGHVANIAEEERVSSVGGSRRHNAEVLSDRRSSLDQSGERRINWLSDPDMLPSEIPGVRVMCYTYKSPKKVPSPHQYLNELGKDLARRLAEMRPQKDAHYNKVPIIFVGLGFGCLILQRVITLLDFEYCRSPTAHPLLAAIAGVIFLDAPAPIAQFPSSRSQETNQAWTQDWLMTKNDSKIDTSSLWRAFWVATMSDVELTWYYSPTGANAQKVFIDVPMAWCRFIPTQSTTAHRLSRFEGPNDIDYRSIVEAAKRIIITKCCIAGFGPLAGCLADFMRDGFPIDLPDHRGFTPLHLAIRNWNLDAVKRLTHQGNASVFKKDNGGRSPLHTAVLAAGNIDQHRHVYEGEEIDPRKIITQITNVLLKKGARVDDKDMFGKTPWSYVKPKNEWIKRLKYKHLIIGSSSTTSRGMESVRPPLPGPQQDACNAFDMILAEVYVLRKAGRSDEAFNFEVAPVFDAIYKASSGVSRLLDEARLPQLASHRLRCRWLHVPSNNEQWVYDLMLSLGIQDNSMGRQRHEGSQLIDRYMMPQARRYKYFHGKPVSPQADPGKRVNRMATTDIAQAIIVGPDGDPDQPQGKPGFKPGKMSPTPAPTMTEADGIVIFMPILGFETHRQRKFLAQSFRDIDHAMQKRRALGEDDSPWPVAQFANPVSEPSREDNQDEAAERSDGMSSVGEQSIQANPGFEFITRARRHIKTDREAKLLRGYLDSKQVKPVHCRRTLDQFLYYMLDSTEARDKTQVAYRWAKNSGGETEQQERRIEAKDRPIVMVDQLWLWALHDGTVITSCPSTWAGHEEYNLNDVIVKELKRNKDRRIIQSAEELLHLILKTSLDFFRRKGPAGFQFHECFQSSINKVSEKQGKLFNAFRQTTEKLHVGTLGPEERKREIEVLFSLEKETELLVEIMDIQDELTIVKTILGQQHDVLEKLLRLYPKRVEEDADEASKSNLSGGGMANSELVLLQNLVQLLRDQAVPPTPGGRQAPVLKTPVVANALQTIGGSTAQETIPAAKEGQRRGGQALKGGQKQAEEPKPPVPVKANVLQDRDLMYETLGIVENNLRIVTDMLDYAAKVESSIENLLDLKQKHANGWEARFAREGSEESQRQGNIILVFTLVTVVFLPLSFFASFFALDLDIFPRDPVTGEKSWPIGEVSGYLCTSARPPSSSPPQY
ncbi:hypothetical protein C8A05DRAFT_19717 [Staphylotrichum tortipilum]|uniref:Ankyrin repeat protein n=1 Tax=Staphylotrichum tortipilum TaxID=2831512 RepID=A0AAN6MAW4_9PEZI|nr:hypothetical protein C8A05DRAFT_19717 [Staphylotrichum longicolle]